MALGTWGAPGTLWSLGTVLLVAVVSYDRQVAAEAPAAGNGSDWPAFLGPTGDSKSSETGILTDWPADGPPLLWWHEVGQGYSAPTVAAGRLFHFDRQGDQMRLTCLDRLTGREIWRAGYATEYEDYYGYSNGPRASPVVDGDRVYSFGVDGRLRCHRVGDGSLLWEVDTSKAFGVVQNFFGVGSSPVVEEDLLIVPIGGSPSGSPRIHSGRVPGNGSGIVAFDKRTGEVRYQLSDELASYATPVLATIGGRRWGFAFTRGGLMGFEPRAGKMDFFYPWRAKILESVNAATPLVIDDTVLITETYGPGTSLLRVAPGGYEVVWKDGPGREKSLQAHWTTPVYHQGFVYASSGRSTGDAELRCIEHATGKIRWSQAGLTRAALLYVDGHFVVLGEYGKIHLIRANPERYEPVAVADLGAVRVPIKDDKRVRKLLSFPAWNAPVLSHGVLYLRGKDTLVALELIPRPARAAGDSSAEGI